MTERVATRDKPIAECTWHKCISMEHAPDDPCNNCGGYRRECAESGKYFPRGEDTAKRFVEYFLKRSNDQENGKGGRR